MMPPVIGMPGVHVPQFIEILADNEFSCDFFVILTSGEEVFANPRILAGDKLIAALRAGTYRPAPGQEASLQDGVLRLTFDGLSAIYVLGDRKDTENAWEAHWPD